MIIGIPREIKNNENRVGLTPGGVKTLIEKGHTILVEQNAGTGIGISDEEYVNAGAKVLSRTESVYPASEMVVKVKEPLPEEYSLLKSGQIVFTFLHLAADRKLAQVLLEKKIVGIAYETIQLEDGTLPLLSPMSSIAGRLAVQVGVTFLQKNNGGKGIMSGGIEGTNPAKIVIIGGGVVGINAASIGKCLGASVTVLEVNQDRIKFLKEYFKDDSNIAVFESTQSRIAKLIPGADLLIGAVLIPGKRAPVLVTRDVVGQMEYGSVIVDVAVDQGGIIETMKPTSHERPTYVVDGVIHYGVANIPGIVPRTSTVALTSKTLPYIEKIADLGWIRASNIDESLARGINTYDGTLANEDVAKTLGLPFREPRIS